MVETMRVSTVLGGDKLLGDHVDSLHRLAETVLSGFPKQALRKVAQRVFDQPQDVNRLMYRLVPEATYKRRTRLTPAESERTERLARIVAASEYVWDDDQKASRAWLTKAHPELGGVTPLDRSMSELGAREVEELLAKLFYGLPS
jgi:putative toxin-antitoxin system antitoxin component (TIGR02293 family)